MIVDIHNHILPGLDDGASTVGQSLLLIANAGANGIKHIIATPHQNETYKNKSSVVYTKVCEMNALLQEKNIPVTLYAGMEILLNESILDNTLLTLANSGKYLLIELPNNHFPPYLFDVLYKLQLKGLIPIIAHPEKNLFLMKNKGKLLEIVARGALLQITAGSVLGKNGTKVKAFSKQLLKEQLVHFIASDAHSIRHRPFLLTKAYEYIESKYGTDLVEYFKGNSEHVLKGSEFNVLDTKR
ncbi:tyrosine-protein phosphatase [Psychrobacillus antarcticus]|uniref:tyrosine-protein phosphatase n=1 Tax=Psychrobacillus antarcticus TaxID=2879115 RepID=UPI002407D16E|nr:CpsB/CapC family capsule biosynthesis tyrosine phosphatase [Psychrobacillus antarcticus]